MSYVRTAHFRMTLFVFICVSVGAAISIKSLIILNCPVFIGMERLEELFSFSEQESYQLQVTPPSTHLNPVKVSNMVIYLISCL